MNPESIPGILPLAEALRAWSNPELLRAVEVAEAPFTLDQCDQHQREWLAEIIHRRQHPQRKRREPVEPRYQALENAWYQLFVDFNAKVASGEIVLWGRMITPLARADAEPLPAVWADELLYHPGRGTVLFRENAYRDVTVGPRSSAALLEARLRATRRAAGPIPLAAALREWTDPALLSEVCRHEREHTPYEMAILTTHLLLSKAEDLAQPSGHRWMLGAPDFTRFMAAWHALENDFRARLVRGEFHLRGVMAKPRREQHSEILPGAWAADLAFDFQGDAVRVDDARYVAVTASYGAGPGDEFANSSSERANGALGDQAMAPTPTAPRRHRGGRMNTKSVVEEALRAHWDELFPKGAPVDPGPWTRLASRLIKRVGTSGHQRRIGFPQEETVRKHLREIYGRLVVEKGEIAPNDQ